MANHKVAGGLTKTAAGRKALEELGIDVDAKEVVKHVRKMGFNIDLQQVYTLRSNLKKEGFKPSKPFVPAKPVANHVPPTPAVMARSVPAPAPKKANSDDLVSVAELARDLGGLNALEQHIKTLRNISSALADNNGND